MTLSGLRSACSQTSSPDPIADYDEAMRLQPLKSLKDRGLVRIAVGEERTQVRLWGLASDESRAVESADVPRQPIWIAGCRNRAHRGMP
jgi:hypothetical protein